MAVESESSYRGQEKQALVVVAHPDDEVLWAGGLILTHPRWTWRIISICRAGDPDRAPKFRTVLERLDAVGDMASLDDGPGQRPLAHGEVENAILAMMQPESLDIVITHGPRGEYTRHRRHEEVCRAVVALWQRGDFRTNELWMFAYDDGDRRYLPRANRTAPRQFALDDTTWQNKQSLITQIYGFTMDSWEARTTPRVEAFWTFRDSTTAVNWVKDQQEGLV